MDHILEHEGQPIPDLSGVTESSSGATPARDTMDVEDDEDADALRSLGAAATGAVEAKVCPRTVEQYMMIYVSR